MRVLLSAAIFLLVTAAATAQTVEQQVAELRQAFSRPIVEWDSAFIQATFQKYVNLDVNDLLWDPGFQKKVKDNLPGTPPSVVVQVTGEVRTPYAERDRIVLPVEYIAYLSNISTLIGHDLYGGDHFVHLSRPLLSTPYRVSAIMPLLSPLYRFVDNAGYQAIQYYLRCLPDDARCTMVQASAANALILFALLHEISHQYFHHDIAYEGVDLDKELVADRNAFVVLTRLTADFSGPDDDTTKEIRRAYRLSPIVWLEVEESRSGLANVVAKGRKEALLKMLTDDERSQVSDLLEPETDSGAVRHLRISWNEEPTLLVVDGLAIACNEVKAKTLMVTAGSHTVLAVRPNQIAVAKVVTYSDQQVLLEYQQFLPADVGALKQAEANQDWAGILSRTSDEQLRPRDSGVGVYHWEALHHLGLDALISIDDWSSIPAAKQRTYLYWEQSGKPLSSWYLGAAR